MSGDHNEKATCSNSPTQEKENVVEEYAIQEEAEAALEFLQETNGTDGNDAAIDGNRTTTGTESTKLNKQRMERRRNKLENITDTVLEVSHANSEPVRPPSVAASYGGQCGCILRDTVLINEKNIREYTKLCASFILKLHKRYTFPDLYNTRISTKI
jgi:hypothetical protein